MYHRLPWTPFVPFTDAPPARRQFPNDAGLYRIKIVGRDELAYIGQTGRNLREQG